MAYVKINELFRGGLKMCTVMSQTDSNTAKVLSNRKKSDSKEDWSWSETDLLWESNILVSFSVQSPCRSVDVFRW